MTYIVDKVTASYISDSSSTKKVSKKSVPEVEIAEEADDDDNEVEEVILFNLSDEDIEFIYDNTHYSLKDIKDWHRYKLTLYVSKCSLMGVTIPTPSKL